MELGGRGDREHMDQDTKVTLQWALRSLERALQNLDDGWAERRVRRQFHQLLLAIERDAENLDAQLLEKTDGLTAAPAVARPQ